MNLSWSIRLWGINQWHLSSIKSRKLFLIVLSFPISFPYSVRAFMCLCSMFFFYVLCPCRTWAIIARHNYLSLIYLRNVSAVVKPPTPRFITISIQELNRILIVGTNMWGFLSQSKVIFYCSYGWTRQTSVNGKKGKQSCFLCHMTHKAIMFISHNIHQVLIIVTIVILLTGMLDGLFKGPYYLHIAW